MSRLLDLQFRETDDEQTHFRKLRALVEEIARLSRQRAAVADGRQWITIAPVPPENPRVDDLWIDCVNWNIFGWYEDGNSRQWVMPAACGGGGGGAAGPPGEPGPEGPAGAAGVGVPAGGALNQVLAKASAADYDTAWVAQTGDGGTGNSYFPSGWG